VAHEADVAQLERAGWDALSTSGAAAAAFYDRVLADDVLMVLPRGLVIRDRAEAIAAMSGAPWDHHELTDLEVVTLGDDVRVVACRGSARRGDVVYRAHFTSTYLRVGSDWRLAVHQQTPV
jgi:hypothetical protein